jgi:hypothetical protein
MKMIVNTNEYIRLRNGSIMKNVGEPYEVSDLVVDIKTKPQYLLKKGDLVYVNTENGAMYLNVTNYDYNKHKNLICTPKENLSINSINGFITKEQIENTPKWVINDGFSWGHE